MIRRLKTWEKFENEFRPEANEWMDDLWEYGDIRISYGDKKWFITHVMKDMFGEKINIEILNIGMEDGEVEDKDYTHYGMIFYWHESWFEPEFKPIVFIEEKDFKL